MDAFEGLLTSRIRTERMLSLSQYSSFHIGGAAKRAVFPKNREELLTTLRAVRACEERYLLIGKGSNVVFSDEGFDGTVIFTTDCKQTVRTENGFLAEAGASFASIAVAARDASLGGMEFAHGIPGTLGGAVYMNAGAFGGEMSQICVSSDYFDMDTGELCTLRGAEHAWGYRKSFYSEHPRAVILSAQLELSERDSCLIRETMKEYSERRRSTQPVEYPSAGSVFKRPMGQFAGKLIEDCGLKGYTVGGAQVSEKHAGFIVNRGGATAKDVKKLVGEIQKTVFERFGVELMCEIRFLDA